MQPKCSVKLAHRLVRYHLSLASYRIRSTHEPCRPLLSSPHACLTSFPIPITREMISSNFFLYLDEATDTLLKLEGIGGITPHHILYAKCQICKPPSTLPMPYLLPCNVLHVTSRATTQ